MSSSPNPPIPPSSRSNKSGVAGIVAFILAIACVVLAVVAVTLQSGKKAAEQEAAKLKGDSEKLTADLEQTRRSVQNLALERDTQYLRLAQLPPELQGGRPSEALQKINQMYQSTKTASTDVVPSGGGAVKPVTPGTPGSQDAARTALDAVAKSVIAKALDTKADIGTDATKRQVHAQVQTVLARIGAFNKPISGNQKDTMDAVMAFQKANGLKVDGVIGKGTWGKVREKFEALPKTATASGATPNN